jgi:predicted AAA+ superfamily ATPase
VPTISEWLSILETTGQIVRVPPFYENFGKRLVKSPKLYFVDSGLACHLLGITSDRELNRSPFLGPLFDGFVVSEIVKQQLNAGRGKEIYYFRDRQGLEVDLVVPRGGRALTLLEIKASRTVIPAMAESVVRLRRAMRQYDVTSLVVHRRASDGEDIATVREGVRAVSLEQLLSVLTRSPRHHRGRSPREEQRR